MYVTERTVLLPSNFYVNNSNSSGLSLIFAIICIVDVFGVFPIITLPKTIIDCGFTGIFIIIFLSSAQIYTSILLGRCWLIAENINPSIKLKNRYPYTALAELTCGATVSKFTTILLDFTVFGGGIPNLIVASRNLQLLGLKISSDSFDMSFCYWILIIGTIMCPFLWLKSPKDMRIVCSISVIIVFAVFILIIITIFLDGTSVIQETTANSFSWKNLIAAYGILVFQYDIHPTILTIQVDMKNKSLVNVAIISGFLVSLILFFITSVLIVQRYGINIQPSILVMLPPTIPLYIVTVLVALQLGLSSAIGSTSLYQHLDDCMGISRGFSYKRCLGRSAMAALSIIVSESVPRFDLVMALVGGALTGPLVFILPPIFYLKMIQLKKIHHQELLRQEDCENIICNIEEEPMFYPNLQLDSNAKSKVFVKPKPNFNIVTNFEYLLCILIISFGITATIATTYINISNTAKYVTLSPPCIYNIFNKITTEANK